MLRVGMLTSGGDCQGLNAALRGVAKTLYENVKHVEILGYSDGYRGLIQGDYKLMSPGDFSGILTVGGTILGTSRQPFKEMDERANSSGNETRFEAMLRNYKEQELDCLVILGGNGTHKTANRLYEAGLNIVTLPKTIDNDLWGTEMTFGFQSAINIATDVIDGIHTTATSHGRIFIIELMGHKAGWLTLHAGVAGGADIILLPEIPYDIKAVRQALLKRINDGKRFSIIAMAEGAMSVEESRMSKKEYKEYWSKVQHPSVSYKLAHELHQVLNQEIRVTVPGHYQRGGSPCPFDRVFATRCGVKAAEYIMEEKFGYMISQVDGRMGGTPLSEVAGKLKTVPKDSDLVKSARDLGIFFGDESFK